MTLYRKLPSLDQLRRDARHLKKAWDSGAPNSRQRVHNNPPRADLSDLKLADFLHIIALENGFESWPRLKLAVQTFGLDRAARQQRLKMALYHGQTWVTEQLLAESPDLAQDNFGLSCALYDLATVRQWLRDKPQAATERIGPRRPMLHLAFSRHIHSRPELAEDMLQIAQLLLDHGADVNDSMPVSPENDHQLSALYGATGHANNMILGQWLLEQGADPNDNESLYHATELGHHNGLRLVLEHGLALQRREITGEGREDTAAFLADWAERFPGQVV